MAYEEIKKQRFRFLQKLYDISKSDVHKRFDKHNIGKMLGIEANLIETVSEYLTREGLIDSQTNDCGNGFEPTNIGCQNTGSQIQGDKNTVSLSSRQTFPPPTSNIEYRKLLRGN